MKKPNLIKNKETHIWFLSLFLVFIFYALYYYLSWGNLDTFIRKVDPCEKIFCDFTLHYYPTARSIFEIKEPVYGYLYSPFFAIMTSPLGRLSLDTASNIWGLIQITLTLLLLITPLRIFKTDTLKMQLLYIIVFFSCLPVLHNFKWGQVSSLMTITIIAAFLAHRSGKSIWAGILLGFSTSIKYYPGIFILYFLIKKDRQALLAFALTCFFLLFLIPVLIMGFDQWAYFIALTVRKFFSLSYVIENPNSQYFPYISLRFLGFTSANVFVVRVLRLTGVVGAICNLLLLWFINHRKIDRDGFLSFSLLFCTLPFLIETSWHHYFIFLPFLQVSLLQMKKSPWLNLLVILSILLSSIFLVNFFVTWQDYTKWGFSFLASSLILAVVYMLSFEAHRQGRGE